MTDQRVKPLRMATSARETLDKDILQEKYQSS